MPIISIKPLSVNAAWKWRRFKTPEYKNYEKYLLIVLPKLTIPKGRLFIKFMFGFSNKGQDIDWPIKLILDILQKKYGFNDNRVYALNVQKNIVKKGEEYIYFTIDKYEWNSKDEW